MRDRRDGKVGVSMGEAANITPSTQHHPHNTLHTTPSTLHHQTLADAALGALPSYPFCLIPADSPFCFLRCGLLIALFR